MKCFGPRWIALMILVPVPFSPPVRALPVLTAMSWPEGAGRRRGHKTSIARARRMVLQVRRRLPQRELILVVDGGFAAVELAGDCRRRRVTLIGRLRLEVPPESVGGAASDN
jgi:hypothetical protein